MARTLYFGGEIITMAEPLYAEAVLVDQGRIVAVGSHAQLEEMTRPEDSRVDLKGHVLMPGFIDPHSHITSFSDTLGLVQLDGVTSMEELQQRIRDFRERQRIPAGRWITGFGYDNNDLPDQKHPDRHILDAAAPENPVVIANKSGHMGVMNTLALQAVGITASTPDPVGGRIGREPMKSSVQYGGAFLNKFDIASKGMADTSDSLGRPDGLEDVGSYGEPNGYLEEVAFSSLSSKLPQASLEQRLDNLINAQQVYFSYGITTAQDGVTKAPEWELLQHAAENEALKIDVVSYIDMRDNKRLMDEHADYVEGYKNHVRIGGYKIFLDGSPQGRTAWMSKPYEGSVDGYRGYPVYTDDEVISFLVTAFTEGRQILAHCNGDAAADQFISCTERALRKLTNEQRNWRTHDEILEQVLPVMIHAQLVRRDQLPKIARLHMAASMFVAHVWYWGDIHLQNFGEGRAKHISPAHTAMADGVLVTFHQDTPVLPPDMLQTIWCAVNRITKDGVHLGEDECVSPLDALMAVTINAAKQYHEESEKGSLETGKLADMVVLDRNPLGIQPMEIKDIKVLQTIKGGEVVYAANV